MRTEVLVYNSVAAAVVPAYGEVLIRLLARSGLTTPLLPIRATIAAIGGTAQSRGLELPADAQGWPGPVWRGNARPGAG